MSTPTPKKRSKTQMLGIGCLGLIVVCIVMAIIGSMLPKTEATPTPISAPIATTAPGQPTSTLRPAAATFTPGPPTATAIPRPTNTVRPTNTPKPPDLEVLDHSSVTEQYARYVVGTVRNNTTKTYSYVQVSINLYDKSGAQVGSTLANVNGLEPGGLWKFKAIILEDSTEAYKIKDVTGF